MTWLLTLAELPRAGTNSKPHHYKQKLQKTKTLLKHGFQRENNLKISDKKNSSSLDQTTPCNTRPLNTTIEYGFCQQYELN